MRRGVDQDLRAESPRHRMQRSVRSFACRKGRSSSLAPSSLFSGNQERIGFSTNMVARMLTTGRPDHFSASSDTQWALCCGDHSATSPPSQAICRSRAAVILSNVIKDCSISEMFTKTSMPTLGACRGRHQDACVSIVRVQTHAEVDPPTTFHGGRNVGNVKEIPIEYLRLRPVEALPPARQSRLTKARTECCLSSSILIIVLLTEPTSPPAPVTRNRIPFRHRIVPLRRGWSFFTEAGSRQTGAQAIALRSGQHSGSARRGSTPHRVARDVGNVRRRASPRARAHS